MNIYIYELINKIIFSISNVKRYLQSLTIKLKNNLMIKFDKLIVQTTESYSIQLKFALNFLSKKISSLFVNN